MNIANWLFHRANLSPQSPALYRGVHQYADYQQFAASACLIGHHLSEHLGIKPGDRVALYMQNRVEYLLLMYASLWVGAVIVPINHKLHPREAAWIIDNAQAAVLFSDNGQLGASVSLATGCHEIGIDTPQFQSILSQAHTQPLTPPYPLEDNALAWLFYTSGTTGRPKGVMLSHGNLLAMSLCYAVDVDQACMADAYLYAAPVSHGAGLYNFIHVRVGARHVMPVSAGFDGQEILDLAQQLNHLSFFAAPTMVKRLVNQARATGNNGTGIKSIIYGGGPMYNADIIDALQVFGNKFIQIYGQGESPMTITALCRELIADNSHPHWKQRLASVGVAHSCVEVRVVNQQFEDLAYGISGEVIVRGPTVMQGYWKNDSATQQALVNGWLCTGDIGHLSADGFLTLTDRSKDVIISGGSNVYPREVEEVLATHPGIAEVAVVGRAHPEWGEEVVAFVVPLPAVTLTAGELDGWCKQAIASFKKPKHYEFCTELPKNSYGKVLKTELRSLLGGGLYSGND